MSNQPQQDYPIQQIMRLAASPAGKQLFALLQKQGGAEFQKALASAAGGDYDSIRRALPSLRSSPEAQALLQELGR